MCWLSPITSLTTYQLPVESLCFLKIAFCKRRTVNDGRPFIVCVLLCCRMKVLQNESDRHSSSYPLSNDGSHSSTSSTVQYIHAYNIQYLVPSQGPSIARAKVGSRAHAHPPNSIPPPNRPLRLFLTSRRNISLNVSLGTGHTHACRIQQAKPTDLDWPTTTGLFWSFILRQGTEDLPVWTESRP